MTLIYIILGLAAGYWLGKRHAMMQAFPERAKVLALFDAGREVTNDTVQTALGVSDATATRMLDALEKEGQIVQMGDTGRGVVYKRK
jgi:predicted HTH transcriptional regulator